VTDPDHMPVSPDRLLSKVRPKLVLEWSPISRQEYIASRAELFNPEKMVPDLHHVCCPLHLLCDQLTHQQGSPINSSDTVYFSGQRSDQTILFVTDITQVTDQWGNAASFIQSNYASFGTGGQSVDNRRICLTFTFSYSKGMWIHTTK
jgi:gamma-glutamyltranspeptidase/glutathione hydrolase